MNTKTLIWIDKAFGWLIANGINWMVRLLGWIFPKRHRLIEPGSIAIAKFKGMGSILQTIPLISTLKKKYPNCKITFVTTTANKEILDLLKLTDGTIILNDKGFFSLLQSFPGFLFRIVKKHFDLYIDLEIYSSFSSIITALSLARNRIGYYLRSENYRFGIYSQMMYYNVNVPVHQTYLQIARLTGCTEIIEEPDLDIHTEEPGSLIIKPYILINPNASDLRLERRWPKEYFTAFINKLILNFPDYHVYLTGSGKEASYAESLIEEFKHCSKVKSVAGKTSMKELINIITHADIFISNDTGPMHLAALLQQRTIALFGPCSPAHYRFNKSIYVIYKHLYCSPCVHEFKIPPCKGNNICMKSISVNEVYQLCCEVLEGKNTAFDTSFQVKDIIYERQSDIAGFIER